MKIIDVKAVWEQMNREDGLQLDEQDTAAWEDEWDDDCCCCLGGYSK